MPGTTQFTYLGRRTFGLGARPGGRGWSGGANVVGQNLVSIWLADG
jgi:hypothetical protein